MSSPVRNFMRQQGFVDEPDALCNMHFSGLYFQPRIVGSLVVVAIVLQSPVLFLVLAAVLCWNVLLPRWNPFERIYNRFIAAPRGWKMLGPAPPARRFAQGMAAAFMLGAALALLVGWMVTVWVLEAFVVIAFATLLFGKFCLGAYIYHILRGRWDFANATLPWARPRA
jgi:Domain of unknown function (DUF4395)